MRKKYFLKVPLAVSILREVGAYGVDQAVDSETVLLHYEDPALPSDYDVKDMTGALRRAARIRTNPIQQTATRPALFYLKDRVTKQPKAQLEATEILSLEDTVKKLEEVLVSLRHHVDQWKQISTMFRSINDDTT